ncbi:MAG: bifunctional oligoribonuclease/PAP phosphatase NrnA [Clostridia bacterium]|nr:bifunctional oligoribonuclease/PAP phosphatase NrnA [Clostridia bacterium]
MKNNTFEEIYGAFKDAKTVLLYPHVSIDGDALGSCVALTVALRKLGKKCYTLYKDELPENLLFLLRDTEEPFVTDNMDIFSDEELDVSCCVDCGSYQRFEAFKDKFHKAKVTVCLDHHGTSEGIADFNLINPKKAAAGEIIYEFLKYMDTVSDADILPDSRISEAIFTAITTDTGDYQFSNTTKEAHLITAELMESGLKPNDISNEIYENQPLSKIKAESIALSRLEILAGGMVAVSYITKEECDNLGLKAGETDGIVRKLRSISGVQYAAFLKEKENNTIRVSYRAKNDGYDISVVAKKHDGGGHKKACGATLNMPILDAFDMTKKELVELADEGRNY